MRSKSSSGVASPDACCKWEEEEEERRKRKNSEGERMRCLKRWKGVFTHESYPREGVRFRVCFHAFMMGLRFKEVVGNLGFRNLRVWTRFFCQRPQNFL